MRGIKLSEDCGTKSDKDGELKPAWRSNWGSVGFEEGIYGSVEYPRHKFYWLSAFFVKFAPTGEQLESEGVDVLEMDD